MLEQSQLAVFNSAISHKSGKKYKPKFPHYGTNGNNQRTSAVDSDQQVPICKYETPMIQPSSIYQPKGFKQVSTVKKIDTYQEMYKNGDEQERVFQTELKNKRSGDQRESQEMQNLPTKVYLRQKSEKKQMQQLYNQQIILIKQQCKYWKQRYYFQSQRNQKLEEKVKDLTKIIDEIKIVTKGIPELIKSKQRQVSISLSFNLSKIQDCDSREKHLSEQSRSIDLLLIKQMLESKLMPSQTPPPQEKLRLLQQPQLEGSQHESNKQISNQLLFDYIRKIQQRLINVQKQKIGGISQTPNNQEHQ